CARRPAGIYGLDAW
nr:immunoglobulin heavy chain junction region [Macaca mulatta]